MKFKAIVSVTLMDQSGVLVTSGETITELNASRNPGETDEDIIGYFKEDFDSLLAAAVHGLERCCD